jgi:hypothetical protein
MDPLSTDSRSSSGSVGALRPDYRIPHLKKDEGENMFVKKEMKAVFLIALLCFTLSMTNSTIKADTHFLSGAAESSLVGGKQCDDFFNGLSIGMGVATIMGCVLCSAGAIGAKLIQIVACRS